MAIQVERTRVCDVCQSNDTVRQYRVTYVARSRQLSMDLCAEHSHMLEELADRIPSKRTRVQGQQVVTPAEVKAARKKPARKRASPKG